MELDTLNSKSQLRSCSKNNGVALVLVLWIIVLLSVIGVSHSRNVRIDMQIARHHVESAKARALAESGLNRAIYELFNNNEETRWVFNGELYQFNQPEGLVQVMIRNTAGLVDINVASPDVLETLLSGLEVDQTQVSSMVDAIMDWRDTDDLKRIEGAEDAEYKIQGLDYGTPDRQFFSIGELRYVLGMNTSIYNALSPYITIFSGLQTINHDYAPDDLSILFGGTSGDYLDSDLNSLMPLGGNIKENLSTGFIQGDASKVFHISIWATVTSGANAGLEVDVDTTERADRKYTILSWQESSQ